MLDAITMCSEIGGNRVEQGAVARRVGGANVVDRFHDPKAHQVGPNAVAHHLGEVGIIRGGHPSGEGFARVGLGIGGLRRFAEKGLGWQNLASQGVFHLARLGREDNFLAAGNRR